MVKNMYMSTRRTIMKSFLATIASLLMLAAGSTAQAQPFTYVTENGSGNVTVINTLTNTVVATVVLGAPLQGIAVNPAGTRFYATTFTGDRIFVRDTATLGPITTISYFAGSNPTSLAFNAAGTRGYVAQAGTNLVQVFDPATFAGIANIPVGASPVRVAVAPVGSRAYVTNAAGNSVTVIDTTNNTVVTTVAVGLNPRGVAVNPAGSRVYVTNANASSVSVIDTSTNLVVATVAVGTNPDSVAVNPAGTFAYVTNGASNSVSVIDTALNAVVATVPVGSGPEGVAFNAAGTRAYVANFAGNTVSVLDTASNVVIATTTVGSNPRGVAVNPTNNPMIPGAPTAATAVAGDGQATVSYTPPAFDGGAPISTYTATSNPGGITGVTTGGPIIVSGLTNGTAYTFTVTATNAAGTSVPSLPSNSVTPNPLLVACQFIPASGAWNVPANWANCSGGNGVPAGTPGPANRAEITGKTALLPAGTLNVGDITLGGAAVIQGTGLATSTLNVVAASSTPWLSGSYTFQNMTVTFNGSAPIAAALGPLNINNSVLVLSAAPAAIFADVVTISGAGAKITNNGIFSVNTSLTMTTGGVFENGATGIFGSASPTTVNGAFVNQGAFLTTVGAPVTLANAAAFSQPAATGFIFGDGTVSAIGQVLTLANGFIEGDTTFNVGTLNNTGAVVSPGGVGTIGTITINGNYTVSAGGSLDIEIAANSFPVFDQLVVSGLTTLTGSTVNFFYINIGFGTYVPTIGDLNNFLVTGTRAGTFAGFTAPASVNTVSLSYFVNGVDYVVSAPAAAITITGTTTFPNTNVGSSSPPQAITITNSGTATLTLTSITHSAPGVFPDTTGGPAPRPGHYCGFGSLAGGTPNTGGPINIAPGGTCVLNLVFAPNAAFTLMGTITINSNAAGSPTSIALAGTGLAPPAPVITSANTAGGVVGTAFTYQIVATNSPTSYGATGLPAGLGVNAATGQITGTPTAAGTFAATVSATNGGGTGSQALTITVTAAAVAPVITSGPAPNGTVGTPYTFTFTASGTTPITWTVATGTVPAGLTLNPTTGVLSGTPTTAGPTGFLVQAANGTAPNATQNQSITIAVAPLIPSMTVAFAPTSVAPGVNSTLTVTLTNPDPVSAFISGGSVTLPAGLTGTAPPSNSCGTFGSFTGQNYSFGMGFIPGSGSCTILITVSSAIAAAYTVNVAPGALTAGPGANTNSSTATLTVALPATPIFSPNTTSLTYSGQVVTSTSPAQTLTITNTGTANLTVGVPVITGPFAIAGNTCVTVIPAGTCTISITFTPTVTGGAAGSLSIPTNAVGSPHLITFGGTGQAPAATYTPAGGLAFGNRTIGVVSAPLTATFTNTSPITVTVSSVSFLGGGAGFNVLATSQCLTTPTVAAGGSCTFNITANPASAAAFTDNAVVLTSPASTTTPANVALSVTGVAGAPAVTLAPPSVAFGARTVNTTSPPTAVTLTNTGTAGLIIFSVVGSGDFGFTTTCPISTPPLAAGANCAINITFTPLTVAALAGNIAITSNAPGSPHTIALSGTGSAVAVPGISIVPAALAFGPQTVNTISALQSVTVTNTGFANLTLSAITVGAPFARVALGAVAPPDCGVSVAPGSSCQIGVSFTPNAVTPFTGQISITDNAAGSPHTVALSGTGTPLPVPVIAASATIAFGDQIINTTGTQTSLISNTGTAPLNISAITLSGTNAANFTLAGQGACTTIAPSASCTLTVTFTPTTTGAKTAQINITSNAQNAAAVNTQTLSGNGILAPRAVANVTTTAIGFGNVIFGGATPSQTITLTNTGGQTMNIVGIAITGDFLQVNNCGTSLASLASCTINVRFTPLGQGARGGELILTTNATTSPDRIPLSGTGCRWFSQTQSRLFLTAC